MEKQGLRIIDLKEGIAMIVTDLHGDWDAYERYRDRFLTLQAQGKADYLIFTGDLIHLTGPEKEDFSLEIVLDVLVLREKLGHKLIYLLGNHELPHIYSITLQKEDTMFTPRFQAAMGEYRSQIISLFESLPFFIRTKAGISICHAGASAAISEQDALNRLTNFSHQEILLQAKQLAPPEKRATLRDAIGQQNEISYEKIVQEQLAVSGPDDPRFDDNLIGMIAATYSSDFELLWQLLTTRNELQYGKNNYAIILKGMLNALSTGFYSQTVLLSGHIDCRGGYTIVTPQQLRLASAKNAHPRNAGVYLLFDMNEKVKRAEDLIIGVGTVFND